MGQGIAFCPMPVYGAPGGMEPLFSADICHVIEKNGRMCYNETNLYKSQVFTQ